jgi:alpha-tubulin suppressor-like RCC1 family protein
MSTSRFTPVRMIVLAASTLLALACADESPVAPSRPSPAGAPSRSLYVSSSAIDLLSIEVRMSDSKEPLRYQMTMDNAKAVSLKMPAGEARSVTVSGHDRYGELTHRGYVELPYVEVGENRPLEMSLESVTKGEAAKLYLDVVGQELSGGGSIVMKVSSAGVPEGGTMPLAAYVFNREGSRIEVDPRELEWAVSDPRVGRIVKDARGRTAFAAYRASDLVHISVIWREIVQIYRPLVLYNPYVQLVAGREFTCGLRLNGNAHCWGANDSLQLGATTTQTCGSYPAVACSNRPLALSGGRAFTSIVAGSRFGCGLQNGAAFCWGANGNGQLGTGATSAPQGSPVATIGGNSFKSLAAGGAHVCGIRNDAASQAMCWGENRFGALGGTDPGYFSTNPANKPQPTLVNGTDSWTMLGMAENTSCGVTNLNVAKCWGYNGEGQGGLGWTGLLPTPTTLNTAMKPKFAATGSVADHMCWIDQGNFAWCTGMNDRGQVGVAVVGGYGGSTGYQMVPLSTYGNFQFTQVTVGSNQTCGLDMTGAMYCWGDNTDGKITFDPYWYFRERPSVTGYQFASLAAGKNHTCGLTASNEIYCWGKNDRGQLGIGTFANTRIPTLIVP